MKNGIQRTLTSVMLMTIMFAGGMTIAIPGELPTAVAQTNTLNVSAAAAGVFGGPQVIEIVIDDPDLDEIGTDANDAVPDVSGRRRSGGDDTSSHWKVVCLYCRHVGIMASSTLTATNTDGDFPTRSSGFLPRFRLTGTWRHRPGVQSLKMATPSRSRPAATSRSPLTTTITATLPR